MANGGKGSWLGLGIDAWLLGIESAQVAGLRVLRLATSGPRAAAEARLMVTEKVEAAFELQADAVLGRLGSTPLSAGRKAVRRHRRKVAANHRRLSR